MLVQRVLQFLFFVMVLSLGQWSLADDKVSNKANLDSDGRPRTDVIPSDNADLEDLQAKAAAISVFAAQCLGMECPILDCEAAEYFQDNLYSG